MYELGVVKRNITRADKAAVERLSRLGVAAIHEAMGRVGLMKPYMRPIYAGAQACGTAVTVLLHPGDNWMMHVAAEQIQDGDIVVAACTSDNEDGFFGDLLAKVIPVENILFGSEMVGAVRGIDPETGHYFDDTKRYIDALPLDAAAKRQVFEGNARRVFPRLNALLQQKGQ